MEMFYLRTQSTDNIYGYTTSGILSSSGQITKYERSRFLNYSIDVSDDVIKYVKYSTYVIGMFC